MNEENARLKRKRLSEDDAPQGSATSDDKWSGELHRHFVAAIYDCGIRHSSPSVIMENMILKPESLTSERVKSHLQKYRKNKEKSRAEFLEAYDAFMRKALTVGGVSASGGSGNHVVMPPDAMIDMMGGGKPSGGDIAAFLSYSVMTEGSEANNTGNTSVSSIGIARESQDYLKNFAGTNVPFPQLSEEEKKSPLGISMVYVMGLFSTMTEHMLRERRKRFKTNNNSKDVAAHPDSPLSGTTNDENEVTDEKQPNRRNNQTPSFWQGPPGQVDSDSSASSTTQQTISGTRYFHPVAQFENGDAPNVPAESSQRDDEGAGPYAQV